MTVWFLVVGAVLVSMALGGVWVSRSPLSPALLYLALGAALGGLTPLLDVSLPRDTAWVEVLAEVAVLVSLFGIGLKLRVPMTWRVWRAPVQLATLGMVAGIAATAVAAHLLLALDWPLALLVAAIVSPTDPVLASDVQVRDAGERDALRITLSAEGGLNDGTAFPFVLLALGLLGAHRLGPFGVEWVARDLVWAIGGAVAIGWLFAAVLAYLLGKMRTLRQPMEFEEFFVLGAISIVYGTALAANTYGFLAVFAAALALRQRERGSTGQREGDSAVEPSFPLVARLQQFAGQLERLFEVALVLLVGALLVNRPPSAAAMLFAVAVLLAVRPLTALASMWGIGVSRRHAALIGWFGIRGIGSVYYLAYALNHGAPGDAATVLVDATMAVIATSIVAHGISATPLMRQRETAQRAEADGSVGTAKTLEGS